MAYEIVYGTIPDRKCVPHRCDTPACVNPAHLFIGTTADNNADMKAKGRMALGEAVGSSKLNAELVRAIRSAAGPHTRIAAAFGVHQSTVTRVKNGNIWRAE